MSINLKLPFNSENISQRKSCLTIIALQFALLLTWHITTKSHAEDGSGLKISASVDMTGSFKNNKESTANDRFDVREAELLLTSPIDHLFDGIMSAAAHREGGVSMFEIHEAYIKSTRIIPRSGVRLGQFFLGIGRLNRFHRHEWPIIFAPKVQNEFFGEEGVMDSGLEYSYLAPLPFFLEITAGATNGWTYGHTHNQGEKPKQPTHYARFVTFLDMFAEGGSQTGINLLRRNSSNGDRMSLTGLDFVAKWRKSEVLNYLLQGELWHRSFTPSQGEEERSLGAYLIPQYALSSSFQMGLPIDYFTVLSLKDISGKRINNSESRISPTFTYKASEFSSLRAAYEWSLVRKANTSNKVSQSLQTQVTYIIGAHPAHEF